MAKKTALALIAWFSFFVVPAMAEPFRTLVVGELALSVDKPEGSSLNLSHNSAVVIRLEADTRFLRGIELELSAPQAWLSYQGSLAMLVYTELDQAPIAGIHSLDGRRIAFNPLPSKIKNVYQIPVRQLHGLRSGPYATVFADVIPPRSFPVLFMLMPIVKGLNEELEKMQFHFTAKPILSDEGAVKLVVRYPEQLQGKPFTVLINDIRVENYAEEWLLREGEHHLVVLSEDYRNENRRFMVERGKTLDLVINLQDPTPLLVFEAPENARIFLNNNLIPRGLNPVAVEPGIHEARFQIGDYSLTRTITVQRGKTYRVALDVGIDIQESE